MSTNEMPKAYEAKLYEDALYAMWMDRGVFSPLNGEPYAIMMPPPNVTGVLHLGHALEHALMDTMARYQRLQGKAVLLVPGTDHAALPTQAKVEKMLMKNGYKNPRLELGRDGLLSEIRAFAEVSKTTILSQIKKMGTSADWSRLAYTFDEKRNKAVNELFARMYKDGLIYRGYRVVNWSVKGQSTCSDDEVEHIERQSVLYTFKYDKNFPIAISSTRPETKLGDTAVAVHPNDERYQAYIGQTFTVDVGAQGPLQIKIIADEHVDPAFGTGALGVTPAHSAIDFAMYERQKAKGDPISIIQVIGADGRMTPEAGLYAGLGVDEARVQFVQALRDQGLLESEVEVTQSVGTSDRFGDVIEAIPMTQWWLDVNKQIPGRSKTLCDLMREALTTGLNDDTSQKVTITPERFTKLYLDRVNNLRDWCLSRQIWWGHRIPVWYKNEEMVVGEAPQEDGWTQDPDTLDTWFSSGSWTFSTLGWPEQTDDLKRFHPTAWMQMGYEILYLWLMRMVLMSTYALGEIPFKNAYIHGMVCDKEGKKFSKSRENGLDPLDVIERYGCDALRMSLMIGTSPGQDTRFYEEKIESGRNFVNKLWNISRFILSSIDESVIGIEQSVLPVTLADTFILSRLETVVQHVTTHIERYEFSQAGELLRDFTWNECADWYLEIAKEQLKGEQYHSTSIVLFKLLERLLTLWHPFMPFVTEEIWKHTKHNHLLAVHRWPQAHASVQNNEAEQAFARMQEIIVAIRNVRAQYAVPPQQFVRVILEGIQDVQNIPVIKRLSRTESFECVQTSPLGEYAKSVTASGTVFVSLEGLVDHEKERQKAKQELDALTVYIQGLQKKLENQEFISKAPEQVVATMRANHQEAQQKLQRLQAQCT